MKFVFGINGREGDGEIKFRIFVLGATQGYKNSGSAQDIILLFFCLV